MRFYSVGIASLAINAPTKWTDNILSHHELLDVVSEKRGVARRIPHRALLRLAVVRELQQELGLGARDAVRLSGELLASAGHPVGVTSHASIQLDLPAVERSVADRLAVVLESAPAPRRGRQRARTIVRGDA